MHFLPPVPCTVLCTHRSSVIFVIGISENSGKAEFEKRSWQKKWRNYFGCVGSYSNTEESKQFIKEGRMFILSGLDSWHDHSFLG